jgi:hypothetical protein
VAFFKAREITRNDARDAALAVDFVYFPARSRNFVPVPVRQTYRVFQWSEFGAYMRPSLAC